MELLKSPLTDDELVKINKFYTLNKDILTLPENVTNLDTFIQSNEIFLEMLVELSRFEQTKAWMHLYKLVRSQNTKSQNLTANDKKSSFNNYLSMVITVVILFVIVIPAFYFFVIREPSKSEYLAMKSQFLGSTLPDSSTQKFKDGGLVGVTRISNEDADRRRFNSIPKNSSQGEGGGDIKIEVNITDSGVNTSGGNTQNQKQLGDAIGNAVRAVIIREKRQGGLLSK